MDTRIEMQKKEFKKSCDDPEARFTKQRAQALDGLDMDEASGEEAAETRDDLARIPGLFVHILSTVPQERLCATQQFRKLLSIEEKRPIQQVIETGAVPRFIEFLHDDSRQDLQYEAVRVLNLLTCGTEDEVKVVVDHGAIPMLVLLLSSINDKVRDEAALTLGNIASQCEQFRDLVLQSGCLEPLLVLLRVALVDPSKITTLRDAAWVLRMLCDGNPRPALPLVKPAIPIIRELIFSIDIEVLAEACLALSYISDRNDDNWVDAADAVIDLEVCTRLVQLLEHVSSHIQESALLVVRNVVSGAENLTRMMVSCGYVPALKPLLNSTKHLDIQKEACRSIFNIMVTRAQIQGVLDHGIIPQIILLLHTADNDVRKEANRALATAVSGGTPNQIKFLVECKVIPPLCEVLKWGDHEIVGVVLEALDAILKVGEQTKQEEGVDGVNPYVHLIKEAGAFNTLERLPFSPYLKFYRLAMDIMKYSNYEEEVEEKVFEEKVLNYLPQFLDELNEGIQILRQNKSFRNKCKG